MLNLISINCLSCQTEYQNYSTAKENKKIETCANCSPAYEGNIASEVRRIGRAEKFHQRQQQAQAKAKEKNKPGAK